MSAWRRLLKMLLLDPLVFDTFGLWVLRVPSWQGMYLPAHSKSGRLVVVHMARQSHNGCWEEV